MNPSTEKSEQEELEQAQQLQRWVRRYAQNRSLPVVVYLVIFALLWLAISVPSYWGGMAYRDGNTALLAIYIGILVVALAATIYVSVPRWGGRRLQQLAERLYAREGRAIVFPDRGQPTWWSAMLIVGFMMCVTATVVAGLLDYLPIKYLQPVSALYVVPFLIALNFMMRPATGSLSLLWPFLYALHALLIVVGAPIVFVRPWESLNMLVPNVGYGLLTAFVCHIYSRWALHSVRTIVSRQLGRADLGHDGDRT